MNISIAMCIVKGSISLKDYGVISNLLFSSTVRASQLRASGKLLDRYNTEDNVVIHEVMAVLGLIKT